MNISKIVAVIACTTMLTACQQPGGRPNSGVMQGGGVNKSDVGTVAGAVAGGVIGHNIGSGSGQTVATIAGTLLGAGIGHSIGSSLDAADQAAYDHATQRALESSQPGQSLPWRNPESGNYGTIVPSNYYQTASGQYCREFNQTIVVGGRKESGHGTACREPDGSWRIVN